MGGTIENLSSLRRLKGGGSQDWPPHKRYRVFWDGGAYRNEPN